MKGFVKTPSQTVDLMVEYLFRRRTPQPHHTILDPGCGTGEFIDGIIRWCSIKGLPCPCITGVESDPRHLPGLAAKYESLPFVKVQHADFLEGHFEAYDYIIGNPPYVAITGLSESEKTRYRAKYTTASGRFDLYLLFFEQALGNLAPSGRLVFVTPEKYLYVDTAGPLRQLLAQFHVQTIDFISEDTFRGLVTYPTVTVVRKATPRRSLVKRRDNTIVNITIPPGKESWLPLLDGPVEQDLRVTLGDVCSRISCGVATGADSVFVRPSHGLEPSLRPFARPTIAGRQLKSGAADCSRRYIMLLPYDARGLLLPWEELGALADYLSRDDIYPRLLSRTCVMRKPWYAFHETPPLPEILLPKILCKDIGATPQFWIDRSGDIVPRHSVYYLVPFNPSGIDVLLEYLRSPQAQQWLLRNCQRASKGYLRLQSRVLQRLPLPNEVVQHLRANAREYSPVPSSEAELSYPER